MNWADLVDRAAALAGPATLAAGAAAGAVVLAGLVVAVRRMRRPDRVLAWIAAAIATGVSGTGMWLVADKALHLDGPLRAVLFGFAEIGLLSSAIRARRHHQAHGRGGPDAAAVWVIAAAAGAVSAMESTSLPEVAVRLTAPLLAAWLWHRGLHDDPAGGRTREAITMRLSTRRILVALRLAEPGTVGLADVDRAHRLNTIVAAALRRDTATSDRAAAGATRRLERAGRRARGYLDPAGIAYIRGALAAVYGLDHGVSRAALADLAPWQPTTATGVPEGPAVPDSRQPHVPEEVPAPDTAPAPEAEPVPDPWRHATPVAVPGTRTDRSDNELLGRLAALEPGRTGRPSIRAIKQALGVNQDRAKRLLALAASQPSEAHNAPEHRVNGVPIAVPEADR